MNKPNITEGEWNVEIGNQPLADTGDYIPYAEIHSSENGNVAQCFEHKKITIEEQQANAKAISAVPEMIDALINTYRYFNKREKPTQEDYMKMHGKIRKALKKAGCE